MGSQICEDWGGFPSDDGTTPKVLKITSKVKNTTTIATLAVLKYSLDSGTHWTDVYVTDTSRSLTTDSITLPTTQDITKVVVQGYLEAVESDDSGAVNEQYVYEIWIEEGT
jgi:hypothetical protein